LTSAQKVGWPGQAPPLLRLFKRLPTTSDLFSHKLNKSKYRRRKTSPIAAADDELSCGQQRRCSVFNIGSMVSSSVVVNCSAYPNLLCCTVAILFLFDNNYLNID
jgi:hypothetical protein